MILAGEGVEVEFKLWETFYSTEEKNIKQVKQEKREKYAKLMCAAFSSFFVSSMTYWF